MKVEQLNDRLIRALKPQTKPYKEIDGKGLYLLVTPSNTKLWYLKYYYASKEKKMSLGANSRST